MEGVNTSSLVLILLSTMMAVFIFLEALTQYTVLINLYITIGALLALQILIVLGLALGLLLTYCRDKRRDA